MKLKPVIKWAGGKKWLAPTIRDLAEFYEFDDSKNCYFEPFFGAGAVFFSLMPRNAVVNDLNTELIELLKVLKNNCEELIKSLQFMKEEFKKCTDKRKFYNDLRKIDREPDYEKRDVIERISRLIFLNKTGFNGLFRVNSQGFFNVPIGENSPENIVNEFNFREISNFLNWKKNKFEFLIGDYRESVKNAKAGDLVYFDPPYDPINETSSFTQYTKEGFGRNEQKELKKLADELVARGVRVILSNNATDFIKGLYKEGQWEFQYEFKFPLVSRSINSDGLKRKKIEEILIYSKNGDKSMKDKIIKYQELEDLVPQADNLKDMYKITKELFKKPIIVNEIGLHFESLNVPRQFQYYYKALLFLEILEPATYNKNKLMVMNTDFLKLFPNEELSLKEFGEYAKEILIKKGLFGITVEEIMDKYKLANETAKRRHHTILAWSKDIEKWCEE